MRTECCDDSRLDPEEVKAMRKGLCGLDNRGNYWGEKDLEELEKLFDSGIGITKIALILGRTETAVMQQLTNRKCFREEVPHRDRSNEDQCRCSKCYQRRTCQYGPGNRDKRCGQLEGSDHCV